MQRPPPLELPAIHTTGQAPEWMTPITASSRPRGSGMFGNGTNRQLQQVETSARTQEVTQKVQKEFTTKSQSLPTNLEAEIASHRSPTPALSAVQAWQREVDIREAMRARKTAELQQKTIVANAFFGSDPRDKSFADFVRKAATIDPLIWPGARSTQLWEQSFLAAHEAQLLRQSLTLLHEQSINVQHHLRAAQAQEQATRAVQAEAARVAAERARIATEQQRQREIAEAARLEQEQTRARDQAKVAALAEAVRVAADQAQIEEMAKRQRDSEIERARAEQDEQQRRAEKTAKGKRQRQVRLKAQWQAQTEARWHNPVFANVGSTAAYGPAFAGTIGNIANNPASAQALSASLRTAVSIALASLSTAAVGFAALLVPSELGNGDLFSASVPLSELAPDLNTDLYELAATGGDVDVPVRLGTRTVGKRIDIVVARTDGVAVPSKVTVRLARFDVQKNLYVSSAGGNEGPIVTWTPLVEPQNPSTDLPLPDIEIPIYEGADARPGRGRTDPFPELDLYGFGGTITIFPIESGIPPIFTIFRDRRQDPGVASGKGQPVSGNWLGAASTPQGAPIPTQIADRLRGRKFANFRAFRRAFWKAMSNDPALFEQFSKLNKIDLRDGLPPGALPSEQVGMRKKLEIHHINPINEGGAVYDIGNLTVLTPKQHIGLHSKKEKCKVKLKTSWKTTQSQNIWRL